MIPREVIDERNRIPDSLQREIDSTRSQNEYRGNPHDVSWSQMRRGRYRSALVICVGIVAVMCAAMLLIHNVQ